MKTSWRFRPIVSQLCILSAVSCSPPSNLSVPSAVQRASSDFFSSFESNDPELTWTNSWEIDSKGEPKSNGTRPDLAGDLPGSIMDQIASVSASSENIPYETALSAIDGDHSTKWLTFASQGWVQVKLRKAAVVRRFTLSSANDVPARDPTDFILEGSDDGANWNSIDERRDQRFDARHQTLSFTFSNERAFSFYRMRVSRNAGANELQLADWQLSNGQDNPPVKIGMRTFNAHGPTGAWNAKQGMGYSGQQALRYAGRLITQAPGFSYNRIYQVDVPVTETTELSYMILPDNEVSSFASVDLLFDDGTYLSDLNAVDQHFVALNPKAQGNSRTLYANEWNQKIANIGTVAAGKRIQRILVAYDNPLGTGDSFSGWIDDIRISAQSQLRAPTRLSDYVLTTRGTNSSSSFSRGNNFPATALPHGFNFWTPVTDAGSESWLYTYHAANNRQNLPALQALALSHEPSPWMGERQAFQVMPSAASGRPALGRVDRALAFRHENEIARAHHYSVSFENGIKAEIAPTDHAAIFRFRFPDANANLIFDNINDKAGLTLNPESRSISGYTDTASGLSVGASRMFIYAVFDQAVAASEKTSSATGYYRFQVDPQNPVVHMRIATSLISVDQAKRNLALEIKDQDSFDSIRDAAQALWEEKLKIVEVEGANFDQMTTLYSNLYRLFLYPNSGFENTGTAEAPVYQYASPVTNPIRAHTENQTGSPILNGKIYVNNGFWDTYRTTWPALSLLTPSEAGELIDGFVSQYKDGGWIARWSSPGYADLMTGTSSDVAFADAFVKGVKNFDSAAAYNAALKNATVLPNHPGVGRKGLESAQFLGYTPTETGAGFSWAMAAYLNDYGISQFAAALAAEGGPLQRQYAEEAEYFLSRSQQYVNLFDPAVDFFQGKSKDGRFRRSAAEFDPEEWGHDYTETNGWNMAFDAPHDGEGLANLYGGRAALAAKLDQFFLTPETGLKPGGYGGIIHEMREARDVRMGQLGMSNQPSFHIPYLYNFAGQPWKTQEKVRDALARLWIGSSIGQGFLGDEDNGSMASWQIMSALGFYPLQVGSPRYVIGSPLFTKATVHLENGQKLVINAPQNSSRNIYVQGLKVNGESYNKTWLPHELLAQGATLDFEMGAQPSSWGTAEDEAPPSITPAGELPRPLHDIASIRSGDINQKELIDDESGSRVTFGNANPSIIYRFHSAPLNVEFYTLTSGTNGVDPSSWTLKGSQDGVSWTVIDHREQQSFPWRTQTRPFKIQKPASYLYYRLDLVAAPGMMLAEWELLAR